MKKFFISLAIIVSSLYLYASDACKKTNTEGVLVECGVRNTDEDLVGWTYYTECNLYYKQNGEWLCYGTYPIYFNHSVNKDGCNQWVRFSKTGFSPAEYHGNKRIKWSRRVQWQGVYFYF